MSIITTKLLIIGSGPAGYTAGIYAARAGISPVLLSGYQTGGQLTTTTEIENFPGFQVPLTGTELMEKMREQNINLGVDIIIDHAKEVNFKEKPFVIKTEGGKIIHANSIVIATGSSAKRAGIEGEDKFWGMGVSTCATCDGFFYRKKKVAVIGGGNSALVEALHLANLTDQVTLIHRRDAFRAEKIMTDRVINNPNIKIEWDSAVEEIIGTEQPTSVTGIKLKNLKTNEVKDMQVDGVFVAIGHEPNTNIFKGQLELDEKGYIITKNETTKTSVDGIFAAGDVTNPRYKQAITAAGKGCEASLDAINYINDEVEK